MTPNEVKIRMDCDLWRELWRISKYEDVSIATVVEKALSDYVLTYDCVYGFRNPLDPEVVL